MSISELLGNQDKKTHLKCDFADLLKEVTTSLRKFEFFECEAGPSNLSMLLASDDEEEDSDSSSNDSSSSDDSDSEDSEDEDDDDMDGIIDDHQFAKYFEQIRKYTQ